MQTSRPCRHVAIECVCVCAAECVFVSMCVVYNAVGTLTIYCIKVTLKLSLWTQFDRKEDTCAPLLLLWTPKKQVMQVKYVLTA